MLPQAAWSLFKYGSPLVYYTIQVKADQITIGMKKKKRKKKEVNLRCSTSQQSITIFWDVVVVKKPSPTWTQNKPAHQKPNFRKPRWVFNLVGKARKNLIVSRLPVGTQLGFCHFLRVYFKRILYSKALYWKYLCVETLSKERTLSPSEIPYLSLNHISLSFTLIPLVTIIFFLHL